MSASPADELLRGHRILALTTCAVLRGTLRMALSDADAVYEASGAAEALAMAAFLMPTAIVADLGRGDGPGVGFCRRLRGSCEWDATPVLVLADDIGAAEYGDLLEGHLTRYLSRRAAHATIRRTLAGLVTAPAGRDGSGRERRVPHGAISRVSLNGRLASSPAPWSAGTG